MGAKAVLSEAFRNEIAWDQILTGIATGKQHWLALATDLYSVSDAGATEELESAVGEAIGNRPTEVLRFLKQGEIPSLVARERYFGLSVCQGVDIDSNRYDSVKLAFAEIAKRKRALHKVTDPKLKDEKDARIQALEDSKSGILRFYGKTEEN